MSYGAYPRTRSISRGTRQLRARPLTVRSRGGRIKVASKPEVAELPGRVAAWTAMLRAAGTLGSPALLRECSPRLLARPFIPAVLVEIRWCSCCSLEISSTPLLLRRTGAHDGTVQRRRAAACCRFSTVSQLAARCRLPGSLASSVRAALQRILVALASGAVPGCARRVPPRYMRRRHRERATADLASVRATRRETWWMRHLGVASSRSAGAACDQTRRPWRAVRRTALGHRIAIDQLTRAPPSAGQRNSGYPFRSRVV